MTDKEKMLEKYAVALGFIILMVFFVNIYLALVLSISIFMVLYTVEGSQYGLQSKV